MKKNRILVLIQIISVILLSILSNYNETLLTIMIFEIFLTLFLILNKAQITPVFQVKTVLLYLYLIILPLPIVKVLYLVLIVIESITILNYIIKYIYQEKILENHYIGYQVFKGILSPIFKLIYHPKVINKHYIPKSGPVILAGNHRHLFDQCLSIPSTKRMVHYMAKKEYFDDIKTSWFFKLAGCIPVNRNTKDENAKIKAIEVLNNNQVLGIFPEGTRNRTNSPLLPFKYGAVSLANKTNALIVPFAITGEYKKFKNNLTIEFAPPIKICSDLEQENKKLEQIIKEIYLKNNRSSNEGTNKKNNKQFKI